MDGLPCAGRDSLLDDDLLNFLPDSSCWADLDALLDVVVAAEVVALVVVVVPAEEVVAL